ncbi:MAG: 5-oxoprolinase subunit PxpB [Planctomycetota bacterium]
MTQRDGTGHRTRAGTTRPARRPELSWASDRALRVSFGDEISLATQRLVHAACKQLAAAAIPGLQDLTPAYTTVLITFDGASLVPDAAEQAVRLALSQPDARARTKPGRTIEIPVCYDRRCAPDLDELALVHSLSPEEVAIAHSAQTYSVGYLGFTPGFAYLHGLPAQLATPRLPTPRPRVPAGSVGIAGTQTGIYPSATPGGWRLIGRTPIRMFDPARDTPARLTMGDTVRFVPITFEQFEAMSKGTA